MVKRTSLEKAECPIARSLDALGDWWSLLTGDLFERIRISMPADRPGRLTREQDADILAFMLSVSEFPAGKAELGRQTEVFKQIRFDSTKPER